MITLLIISYVPLIFMSPTVLYYDTMSYDKHLTNSNDSVGRYFQQPVQWWTFEPGIITGGNLPFLRFAPNHPYLAENYTAGQTVYYLYFDLSSNWTGFLKRDFTYLADRTDDWLS